MNATVKNAVRKVQLEKHSLLKKKKIGSHSLQEGGAMTMHLKGCSNNTIKKMGQWSSGTFSMYTHEQISAFSVGISKKMSTPINFHNIAFQPTRRLAVLLPAA